MTRNDGRPTPARADLPEDKKYAATQTPNATVLARHSTGDQRPDASVHAWQRAQRRAIELRPRLQQLGLTLEVANAVLVAMCEDLVAAERWRTGLPTVELAPAGRCRARAIEEARRPRPGDFPGGSVPLWGPGGMA